MAQLIGKTLVFSSTEATCFGDTVSVMQNKTTNPTYQETNLTNNDMDTDYRCSFSALGITANSLLDVRVTDPKNIGCDFLVVSSDRLLLSGGGDFFELVRAG